jgi:hypothetical protein
LPLAPAEVLATDVAMGAQPRKQIVDFLDLPAAFAGLSCSISSTVWRPARSRIL